MTETGQRRVPMGQIERWANIRADDAGILARDLRDSLAREAAATERAVKAEAALAQRDGQEVTEALELQVARALCGALTSHPDDGVDRNGTCNLCPRADQVCVSSRDKARAALAARPTSGPTTPTRYGASGSDARG